MMARTLLLCLCWLRHIGGYATNAFGLTHSQPRLQLIDLTIGGKLGWELHRLRFATRSANRLQMQSPGEWFDAFEKTSSWMSPTGGDAIPGFFQALDVSNYIDSPIFDSQPVLFRVGVGLLVVDVIPLAIDALVFKWLFKKFSDSSAGAAVGAMDNLQIFDLLRSSELVAFFDDPSNQGLVSSRSTALLKVFYADFFDKFLSSGQPPEVLLFQLFIKLGPAFETVAISLVQDGLIRSSAISAFLTSSIALPTAIESLQQLDAALKQASTPTKLNMRSMDVLSVTPLGVIYVDKTNTEGKVVVGMKPDSINIKEVLVDLYIIRRLVQSFASYPAVADRARLVLPLIDSAMDSALQLSRIFAKTSPPPSAPMVPTTTTTTTTMATQSKLSVSSSSIAIIPYISIYL